MKMKHTLHAILATLICLALPACQQESDIAALKLPHNCHESLMRFATSGTAGRLFYQLCDGLKK